MVISKWITITNSGIRQGNLHIPPFVSPDRPGTAEQFYHAGGFSYPKFFKMDDLCKWAWIGAECLLGDNTHSLSSLDKNRIAVVLFTRYGCLGVDKRFQNSIALPSPALFVYTLPNIMLGEICIRHGIRGEQLCMVSECFDVEELFFAAAGMLQRDMDACLCGWVDVTGEYTDVSLFWVTKNGDGIDFTPSALHELHYGRSA